MKPSQPDQAIPRRRWPAFLRFVTQDACGLPVVVQQPADPTTEATTVPRPLESIDYYDDTDEIVVATAPIPADARAGGGAESDRIRIPRPHAVLADDVGACPATILIHSRQVPPTVILFEHASPTAPGTP
jgi:hypothetical protein